MLEDTAGDGTARAAIGRIPMFGAHGARTRVVFGALLAVVLAGGPGVTAFGASSSASTPSSGKEQGSPSPSKAQSIAAAKSGAASAGQGLGSGEKLVVKDVITDADGSTHVRYDRTFDGLRVIGGDFVSHRDKSGRIKGVTWNGARQVVVASTKPKTSLASAKAVGDRKALSAQKTTSATQGELVVYSGGGSGKAIPKLAYDVLTVGVRADQTPSRLHTIVDANTGATLASYDEIQNGTGNSLHSGAVTIGTTAGPPWSMLDTVGNYATDLNAATSGTGTTFTDADNIWGNGTNSDPASAGVDAQYGAEKTFDYFNTVLKRNGIWDTGVGARSRVHYGTNYANAYWDGTQMTYGDGAGNANPVVELDVAGHEMTHGVTEHTAGLLETGEAGGLNEGTSDIFGTAVEWYANSATDKPDYLIGELININGDGTPLRYMDQPSKDGLSPDCWSSTVGGMDPHYASGPLNHWFYLASEGSGARVLNGVSYDSPTCNSSTVTPIGRDAAAKIWYHTLTTYLTSSSTYAAAREGAIQSAKDLYPTAPAVCTGIESSFSAIGVPPGAETCAATPPPPSGSNLLSNPGFESGDTLWSATPYVIDQWLGAGQPAHSGTWSAWLGGYGVTHDDSITQLVTIPASTSATLSYYIHIDTDEAPVAAYDTMTVRAGTKVLQTLSNVDEAAGYQFKTVDLSAYVGTTISLSFSGSEDASLSTSFVLDDLSVTTPVSSTAPGAPTGVSATPGNAAAVVSWTAPASNGGSPVTGYTATSSPGGKTATTTGATTATVTGLTNGTAYTFTVTATNAAGTSTASVASTAATPRTVPGAPTGVSATASNAAAVVSWTAPASNGGSPVTGYTATSSPGGKTATTTGATTATVTGLTNGTAYTFTVTATNAAGTSTASVASTAATPRTVPGAPTAVSATPGNASAVVTWTAPASSGGSVITGYTVTASPGGATVSTAGATTGTVAGLTNGTSYTFTVTATNAAGTSPASSSSAAVTPRTVPGAPTGVTAIPGNGQVAVSWIVPASSGGSAVTGYTVTASPGGASVSTIIATTATVSGLMNGTAYTFSVTAANVAGNSLGSLPSAAVTPSSLTAPDPPSAVTATPGNSRAVVSWTAPADSGGSAITGYNVRVVNAATSVQVGLLRPAAASASSLTVTGLVNGTAYTFTVTATNVAGTSLASSASAAVTPLTVPGAPTAVMATAGNTQALVSWVAPSSSGGSPVTGYTVTATPGGASASTIIGTTATVTGLTNGTAYTFKVTATNAAGSSLASLPSAAVTPKTLPGAPTAVTATVGNALAVVSWTVPSSNGGSAVTGYNVRVLNVATGVQVGLLRPAAATATSLTVTGLANGTAYTFTVTATNVVGVSPASLASAAVTPRTVPGAPTAVMATAGDAEALVSWTAPVSDGGSPVTGYNVRVVNAATGAQVSPLRPAAADPTSVTVTGLTNGTAYRFMVTAINVAGSSVASTTSATVTPKTVPDAPTGVTASPWDTQAVVSWTAPASSGGSLITGYTVTASPDGATASTTGATTATVTGLANGTAHTFTVTATSVVGLSPESLASAAVTPFFSTPPDAPTAVAATPGSMQAMVSWTAPVGDGGRAVTGYTVRAVNAATSLQVGALRPAAAGATSLTVTGLTNGTAYRFQVLATNLVGASPFSALSYTVTPAATAAVTRTSDFNRDGFTDLVARDAAGVLWLYPGNGAGAFPAARQMGTGWDVFTAIVTPGDVTGDGNADVLAVDGAGALWLYPGNGASGLGARRQISSGWQDYTISSAGNVNGTGAPDLLARDTSGVLWLYPLSGNAILGTRTQVAAGWGAMTSILGPGDVSGDGRADILGLDATGGLWLYRGNGTGGIGTGTLVSSGWQDMTALVTPGNWNRAVGNDLLTRDAEGTLWFYPGNNAGGFGPPLVVGSGWNGMTYIG